MSDFPAAPSPSSQSQQDDTPPDVQHGVIMNKLWPIKMYDGKPKTVLYISFVGGSRASSKMEAVRTTIMKRARDKAMKRFRGPNNPFHFVTWEDCANIEFRMAEDYGKKPDIRIKLTGDNFQSAIGTDANGENHVKWSMELGPLANQCPPTDVDRRHILHEFGHALGLNHEHQGPAAQKLLELDKELVTAHYRESARDNVLEGVDKEELWNYTNLDTSSIMIYRLDRDWQKQARKYNIERVYKLSEVDQACIKLMYPPDLTIPTIEGPFKEALVKAGVDVTTAGKMMDDFVKSQGNNTAVRLTRLRDRFCQWRTVRYNRKPNPNWISLHSPKYDVASHIDAASLKRSGIDQFAGEVTKNKLFQSIMKNIVYRTMVQQGIPTNDTIPGATPTEVTKLIAALSMHDKLGQLVKQHRVAFSGEDHDEDRRTDVTTTTETPAQ